MNQIYDYQRFAILYVDDEEKSLKYFGRAFGETFKIYTATNAQDGYRLLEQHKDEIGILMSDQRMPGEQGVQFLERARRLRPQIIRMLVTAYADLDAAISAVNTGAIYKYVTKPWDVPDLETTLKRGLEFYMVQQERDHLLTEKLSSIHRLIITDRVLSLGVLAAGLSQHLRHALDAVRTFLEVASQSQPGDQVDLNQLRNPNFWPDFQTNVRTRLRQILTLLDDLAEGSGTPFKFESEVQLRNELTLADEGLASEIRLRQLQVINDIPADLPALIVDAQRFRKLFSFLLRNELTLLPEGGQVRFEASVRTPSGQSTPEIELVMTDNGPGIPTDALTHIFDPLRPETGSTKDIGLYLMACFFIVYHHGGRVELTQAPQGGSRLTIVLPQRSLPATGPAQEEDFLLRAMSNERLWERLLAGT